MVIKDTAKYYKNKTHAIIHVSKNIMDKLNLDNKEPLILEFDEATGKLTLQPLKTYKG
jgi:hypothetical protein